MPPGGRLFVASWSSSQRRMVLGICVVLATVLVLFACAPRVPFLLLWRLGVAQPYPWADAMSLQSISMGSADDGWAVGHISGTPTTLLMHYAQGRWTILPKPAGLDDLSELTAVAMVSPSDGWAWASRNIPIGDRSHSFRAGGVLLHYDGAAWRTATPVFSIAIGSFPSALMMLSSTDGWATGENTTLHYDGTAWRDVAALSDQHWGGGVSIAATSPSDIWIARWSDIVHFDGQSWTEQPITLSVDQSLPGPIQLHGIAMISPQEGFAVGGIGNSSTGVILHYMGGRWSLQRTVGETLDAVALRSANEGWTVGASDGIYHFVAGVWTKAASPVTYPLYSVVAPPTGSDPWAVGFAGVLLRGHDGAWQQETNVAWSKDALSAWK